MFTKKMAFAATVGSTLLLTGCASWFQYEPPTPEDLAERDRIYRRFEYSEERSYACNLYNTLYDGNRHCSILDIKAGKVNNPRSPDFSKFNKAASLMLAAGNMVGLVGGSGLGDVIALGMGTPNHDGMLTANENHVEGMFVIPAEDYPDASTAIRSSLDNLQTSIAQACKAIGYEYEGYENTLEDFFAHKYAVHAEVRYVCSQKNPVDSPRDVTMYINVGQPKHNFVRQPEIVPDWMDEKQPRAYVATHIGWNIRLWNGVRTRDKSDEERVDFILKEGRDSVKLMAAMQKHLPQGVYLFVSPFQVGAGQFTVPYVMTRDKTWFFGIPDKDGKTDDKAALKGGKKAEDKPNAAD